ncbi:MAG: tetratricopeptide repeat protein [Burkholderiaceae bacterium]|nr:tetratricopeptide repeat protein [Burkholderiaceae bacterium]
MIDANQTSFSRDVIEASREGPVLVDFRAPWSGPCRMLGPMLEKLEAEYGGRFRLVKVNSDENPELAAQFRVRSIPYVVAFVDGQPVDAFVGVLPEGQLRAFLAKLLPDPSEIERRKALKLADAGAWDEAAAALRASIALDPGNDAARLDLATLLLERMPPPVTEARINEAREVLAHVSAAAKLEARYRALQTHLDSLAQAARLPSVDELQRRIEAQPGDLQARLDLARLYIAQRRFEPALEQLMEIVSRDRKFGDDIGRKTMLAVFEMAADQPALVSQYRRRLAAELHR